MNNPLGISINPQNLFLVPEYAEAGFEVAEISMPNQPLEQLRAFGFDAQKSIRESGMKVFSVHLPFGRNLDLSEPDDAKRSACLEHLFQVIDLARELGASTLVVHGSSEPNPDSERALRMKLCADSLKKLQAKAGELRLAVENLPRTCIGRTGAEMVELSQCCAGICFDVNHLLIESHEQFMSLTADSAITTHLSDYDGIDERHWLPGMGIVPFKQVRDTLLAHGYAGPFLFELGIDKTVGQPYPPKAAMDAWKKVIG